jgi:hypothetical protein
MWPGRRRNLRPGDRRTGAGATRGRVDLEGDEALGQVDDCAAADIATRHAAAGAAGDERGVSPLGIADQGHHVRDSGRHGHALRHDAIDAGAFGVGREDAWVGVRYWPNLCFMASISCRVSRSPSVPWGTMTSRSRSGRDGSSTGRYTASTVS